MLVLNVVYQFPDKIVAADVDIRASSTGNTDLVESNDDFPGVEKPIDDTLITDCPGMYPFD